MSDILKSVIQDLINDRTEQASVSIHQYIVNKTQELAGLTEAKKKWQDMNAEDMYHYATDALSAGDMEKLDDALRGLHVEDEEDEEEAEVILRRFLAKRLTAN